MAVEVIAKPPALPEMRASGLHFSVIATRACNVSRGFAITSVDRNIQNRLANPGNIRIQRG